jgi:hypothetical protein
MPYREVSEPIAGPEAFRLSTDAAILSQAAYLLILGTQLRAQAEVVTARSEAAVDLRRVEALPADDLAIFPVPQLRPTAERFRGADIQRRLAPRELSESTLRGIRRGQWKEVADRYSGLVDELEKTAASGTAAELMEACLLHPQPLVRVAAAWSYLPISADPHRLLDVLVQGTRSRDRLTQEVAATALARYAPAHRRLSALTQRMRRRGSNGPPTRTAMLVHGTFARNSSWWQPGGDFHNYLLTNVRSDLYSAGDRFEWSGGYSDAARAQAASDLRMWIKDRDLTGIDLFGHSHGASVMMLASHDEPALGELVLLSCPVHVPKYFPDFSRVTKVVSIRVRLDLVILADGGGQRFNDPRIEENVLPIWFDHSRTHDPGTWQEHDVPALL